MGKAKKAITKIIPEENIISKIYVFRGLKVILDMDLAELYEVGIIYLKRQVRRSIERFPGDFRFELKKSMIL